MTTVGILTRPDLRDAAPVLAELMAWVRQRGLRVCIEERSARLLVDDVTGGCEVASGRVVAAHADVLVVLGGDGTLLGASHLLGQRPVPVLGVNFGSLGFLTEIALTELYAALEGVLEGRYQYEERCLLRAELRRAGEDVARDDVLNDVVITKASLSRIIELNVSIDERFVSAFRSDGLIISSPTGSTAYNLAAGGPMLHPRLPALVLTPICPHTLTHRPLVVSDDSVVEVSVCPGEGAEAHVTFDGQRGQALQPTDTVVITRSPRTLRLVKAPARDYYEVLRTKLNWGDSTRRRS